MAGGITLAMIVRNEEQNLAHCLASATDLVDEIVIVDTGSSDRTKDLATASGAKVSISSGSTILPLPATKAFAGPPETGFSGLMGTSGLRLPTNSG